MLLPRAVMRFSPSSLGRSAFELDALGARRRPEVDEFVASATRNTIGGVKLRLASLCAVALALPSVAGAIPGLRVSLSVPGHTPKMNAKWFYTVRATLGGKPARATITSQIVDPVGGVHAVEFGDTHRFVTNRPFTGVFRDFVRIPPEARGIRLTFRVIVKAGAAKRTLTYWIQGK